MTKYAFVKGNGEKEYIASKGDFRRSNRTSQAQEPASSRVEFARVSHERMEQKTPNATQCDATYAFRSTESDFILPFPLHFRFIP
jgi:hypothetical protein